MEDIRIVLLGKTGSGKSTSGNTILGRDEFTVSCGAESVTRECYKEEAKINNRNISVIDTPGLFDTSISEENLKGEIVKCVYMSAPGPHVFLLVIRLDVRFTEEEKNTVKWIQENFGEKAMQYTMILFTHNDQIDLPIEQYLEKSTALKQLVNECKAGYHCFNNKDKSNQGQVTELLEKIDRLVEKNRGQHYTNNMYEEAQRQLTEVEERIKQLYEKELKQMKEKMEENRREMEENIREMEENRREMEENIREMEENRREMEVNRRQSEENRRKMVENRRQSEENRREMEKNRRQRDEILKPNIWETKSFYDIIDGVTLFGSVFPNKTIRYVALGIKGVTFIFRLCNGGVKKIQNNSEVSSYLKQYFNTLTF